MDYGIWYGKVSAFFARHPFYLLLLRVYNRYFPILVALSYLAALLITRTGPWGTNLWLPALGFVLLSYVRKKLDFPRPYETWDMMPLISRESRGQSMPSRHVFSASLLSMVLLQVSNWLGLLFFILSLGLGLARVLGGVHYPKDVLAGYLLGLLWGSLLYLF